MKQYTSLLQRILSLIVITGLVIVFAFVGAVFLGYLLVIGAVALVVGWIYSVYTRKKSDQTESVSQSSNIKSGDFSRGPGRIIDHTEEEP